MGSLQVSISDPSDDIINGGAVKIRQKDQVPDGDLTFSGLVAAVYPLVDAQKGADLLLRHVRVLPQVQKPWEVHQNSPRCYYFAYYRLIVFILLSNSSKIFKVKWIVGYMKWIML